MTSYTALTCSLFTTIMQATELGPMSISDLYACYRGKASAIAIHSALIVLELSGRIGFSADRDSLMAL